MKQGPVPAFPYLLNLLGDSEGEMMTFLKAFWQFCSYKFFPQWGRHKDG